jgi:hypothetical protein
MKSIIISAVLIIAITAFAFTSSAVVSNYLGELEENVQKYKEIDEERMPIIYQALYDDYKRSEMWLCIIIDDASLTKIEEDFTDIIVQSGSGDEENTRASIKRLICHLEQIRRLAGFNIKSVF